MLRANWKCRVASSNTSAQARASARDTSPRKTSPVATPCTRLREIYAMPSAAIKPGRRASFVSTGVCFVRPSGVNWDTAWHEILHLWNARVRNICESRDCVDSICFKNHWEFASYDSYVPNIPHGRWAKTNAGLESRWSPST